MSKLSKEEVEFESPAKGPNHCSQCEHFLKPHACEIVGGKIDGDDWCIKFKMRKQSRLYQKSGE